MAELAPHDVVITGIGMQTSLGDAVTSCAAARAGISLARELGDSRILLENGTERRVIGHSVDSVTGFRGQGKLMALAWGALRDLLAGRDPAVWAEGLGFCLCAPPAPFEKETSVAWWTPRSLAFRLVQRAGLRVGEGDCEGFADYGSGFAAALACAIEGLRSDRWQRCVVGAVDSLLDDEVISWLDEQQRLKTADHPDGLQPSEGAAFLLLERRDAVGHHNGDLVTLRGYALAETHDTEMGSALAKAVSDLIATTGPLTTGAWLLSDHNGESISANDLGHALSRLRRDRALGAEAPVWFPATSFGDTAGANGALAICVAARALGRGYAPAPCALATFANDGPRAAVRLERT